MGRGRHSTQKGEPALCWCGRRSRAGERLGFFARQLAGEVDPYLRPLYDALYDLLEPEKVDKMLERNVIEIAPLAFMRGRTLTTPSSSWTRRRTPPSSR